MGKGFSSPAQYRGDDIKTALIRNWRSLVTFINTWAVTFESDGISTILPGDLDVDGNLDVTGDVTVTGTGPWDSGGATISYGAMYISTPAATTISVAGTFYKSAGTTTASAQLSEFTMPSNNRLTYGGTATKVFDVKMIGGMTMGAGYNQGAIQIAKNGTVIAESEGQAGQTASTAPYVAVGAQCLVSLATSDYVEIWVTNKSAGSATTVDGSLVAVEVA